ncbi:unnamed protein product [Effrenium voratum]|uniref:Uncharacterized protein n=1 Tax=Effrenium voratum TaxID=2562239 RepID=A0AA36N8G1_9DINO|nr:unnamed protein product [Effrenium voratum]
MAVVCGDHDRTMYLASFIASYSSQLEVCGSASKGSFLRLTQPCTKGSVLLSVPMSSCLCSWDVSDKALEALHPEPMAPLRLALLTAGYSRTEYFSRAAPLEVFSCHMASWPDASVAAEWAGPSLAWRRVGGWRQELRREWQRLRQASLGSAGGANARPWRERGEPHSLPGHRSLQSRVRGTNCSGQDSRACC